uniref:Pvc16 N-terminal domain-containing protein n=1 Tax=Candidatus Methanophagaceae archaeon ANME-1 ERB6 TaxID=2759912 RepID=A0A7G9YSQ5_9EURY|nr:hypothetical protein EDLMLJLI_00032 [Methanosarcinales archaeon ANME-1 ERB6]
MSDYTAIVDVGETLKKLLWDNIKEDNTAKSIIESEDQITLSSPEETEPSKKLSLFLYQITENVYLKNQEMQIVNSTELKYPPLSLNLFYLVTPHTKKGENDHIILGKVMQIFYDNSILRGSVLQGSLADSREELKLILNPLSMDELNKIWTVMSKSKPYKLSVCYEVTPVKIESMRERKVKRVIERELEKYQLRGER